MYRAGVDALTIQLHGRWVSDTFKQYTRVCKESVDGLAAQIVPALSEGLRNLRLRMGFQHVLWSCRSILCMPSLDKVCVCPDDGVYKEIYFSCYVGVHSVRDGKRRH
jgi:hypothetical protein